MRPLWGFNAGRTAVYDHIAGGVYDTEAALLSTESKRARLGRAFRQRAIPEAAALLAVLDELAGWPGLIWRYDTELGIRASCTAATRRSLPTGRDRSSTYGPTTASSTICVR